MDTLERLGLIVLAAVLLGGCVENMDQLPPQPMEAEVGPIRWSDWANLSLNAMIEEYGPPTRIESKRVVWEHKGPWKRIAVWDEMGFRQTPAAADNIEETVSYLVPKDKHKDLEDLGLRVRVSADGSELSARSFNEARNFLALNLADEVINNVKRPEEAKTFFATTVRLADAGKSSPYMHGLRFQPPPLPSAP